MTALSVQPPFPILTDIDGQPLDDGFIWIGVANTDPIANPVTVYWDAALTITATQPIRTRGGYPINAGAVGRLYVNSDYSIQVQNRTGSIVYNAPVQTERFGNLVSVVPLLDNIADLRAQIWPSGRPAVVQLVNNYVASDGGGFFRWDAASTATDDSGVIIKETATATGRWIRQDFAELELCWFGPLGVSAADDSTALTRMLSASGSFRYMKLSRPTNNVNLRFTSWSLSGNFLTFDGCNIPVEVSGTPAVWATVSGNDLRLPNWNISDAAKGATVLFDFVRASNQNYRTVCDNWLVSAGRTLWRVSGMDQVELRNALVIDVDRWLHVVDGGLSLQADNILVLGGGRGLLDTAVGTGNAQGEGMSFSRLELLPTTAGEPCMEIKNAYVLSLTDCIMDGNYGTGETALLINPNGEAGKAVRDVNIWGGWYSGASAKWGIDIANNVSDIRLYGVAVSGAPASSTGGVRARNTQRLLIDGLSALNFAGACVDLNTCNGSVRDIDFTGAGAPVEGSANAMRWDTPLVPATRATASEYPRASWTAYTPTVIVSGGTLGTHTASGHFRQDGKTVSFEVQINITTNGTGSGQMYFTLPSGLTGTSRETAITVLRVNGSTYHQGVLSGANVFFFSGGSGYPGADGAQFRISGTYEVA